METVFITDAGMERMRRARFDIEARIAVKKKAKVQHYAARRYDTIRVMRPTKVTRKAQAKFIEEHGVKTQKLLV